VNPPTFVDAVVRFASSAAARYPASTAALREHMAPPLVRRVLGSQSRDARAVVGMLTPAVISARARATPWDLCVWMADAEYERVVAGVPLAPAPPPPPPLTDFVPRPPTCGDAVVAFFGMPHDDDDAALADLQLARFDGDHRIARRVAAFLGPLYCGRASAVALRGVTFRVVPSPCAPLIAMVERDPSEPEPGPNPVLAPPEARHYRLPDGWRDPKHRLVVVGDHDHGDAAPRVVIEDCGGDVVHMVRWSADGSLVAVGVSSMMLESYAPLRIAVGRVVSEPEAVLSPPISIECAGDVATMNVLEFSGVVGGALTERLVTVLKTFRGQYQFRV
jgi:hypothetical protein